MATSNPHEEDQGFAGLFLSRRAALGPSKQAAEIRPFLLWGSQLDSSPEKINLFNRFLQIGFVKIYSLPWKYVRK